MVKWEHFSHESDIGIRGIGSTCPEAFEMAAVALTAVVTDPESVSAREHIDFCFQAENLDFLFYDWINHLIYEMDTKKMLFGRFEIRFVIDGLKLEARISGEPIDVQKHKPAVHIKGATFTELSVKQKNGDWICQCVVDV
jgi:SHS2 domain-containing protein